MKSKMKRQKVGQHGTQFSYSFIQSRFLALLTTLIYYEVQEVNEERIFTQFYF